MGCDHYVSQNIHFGMFYVLILFGDVMTQTRQQYC